MRRYRNGSYKHLRLGRVHWASGTDYDTRKELTPFQRYLQRAKDMLWPSMPRAISVTCENCGQRCSFSVLAGKDTAIGAKFVKENTERMSMCPNLIKNPHYQEDYESGKVGVKFWRKWAKAQEPVKVKYPPGIRCTRNKLGGAIYR